MRARLRTIKTIGWALTPVAAVSLLSGCRVGPHYNTPPALSQAPPPAYKEVSTPPVVPGQWKPAQPQDAMLRGKWWEIYNDPQLNELEDKLNIDNQNIKQFFQNFMEARTIIAQARSQLYPSLGVAPAFQRSRASSNLLNSTGSTGGTKGTQSTIWSIPFDASWEPDLFGKIRNEIREAQYAAQVSAADLESERLSEQASLATYVFELRGQDALIQVLKDTVAADQKALDLTRGLYETGIDGQVSVVSAENTLQNAQATATNLEVSRTQFEHAIAVLVGANPSTFSIAPKPLEAAPPPVPLGVPSQLLERRPDIAAAERTMAAANAEIGVATAAFYPTVSLTGAGGTESSAISHLLDWPSRFWSVGSSVSETVFDAGLRRATVNQYVATYNADVAAYRQTVLTGFQQVEDNIASLRILSRQMEQQKAAAISAQRVVDLEMARFQSGIDPYIDVVQAQTTLLTDQTAVATLRTEQMTASVQLIEALGGGWDRSDLPTPEQVSTKMTHAETAIQK
jgi:NodT family efflux transporter outer membrane factor (OMF) lipoprotein